jgi:hypothetical protein
VLALVTAGDDCVSRGAPASGTSVSDAQPELPASTTATTVAAVTRGRRGGSCQTAVAAERHSAGADDRVHRQRHGEASVARGILRGGDESLEVGRVELPGLDHVVGEVTHGEATVGRR